MYCYEARAAFEYTILLPQPPLDGMMGNNRHLATFINLF